MRVQEQTDLARGGRQSSSVRTSGPPPRTATATPTRASAAPLRRRRRQVPGRPQRLGAPRRRGRARPAELRRLVPQPRPRDAGRRCASPTRTTRATGASLQPDFLVVSRRTTARSAASIVDPHGDHLADASSSSARSPTSRSASAIGSSASSRLPRRATAPCASSTSATPRPGAVARSRAARSPRSTSPSTPDPTHDTAHSFELEYVSVTGRCCVRCDSQPSTGSAP